LPETEHRRVVQHRVNYATCADEVATPGDDHPEHLVDEQFLDLDEDTDEYGQDEEEERVLGENYT